MNKKVFFFTSLSIGLLSIVSLFIFRIVPTSNIWDSYTVVYVAKDIPTDIVRQTFESNTIFNVLYPEHQPFPLPPPMAPVQFHNFSTGITYEKLQSSYFSDSENKFSLYYVPNKYSKDISSALKDITSSWGIDSQQVIPSIPFFITTIVSVILFILCKNKILFSCIQIPFILLTSTSPYYHMGASVCVLGLTLFILERKWNRPGLQKEIIKNISIYIAVSLILLSSIFIGLKSLLQCSLCGLTSFSLVSMYSIVSENIKSKEIFKPVTILPAKMVPLNTKRILHSIFITFCAVTILSVLALITTHDGVKTQNSIKLPTPIAYTRTNDFSENSYISTISNEVINRLPDLTDYISTAWHYEFYPFKRLSNEITEIAYPGDTVTTTEYIRSNNTLDAQTKTLAEFDTNYITSKIDLINNTEKSGAEKLLVSQGGFSRVMYDSTTYLQAPIVTVILTICICLYCVVSFLYFKIKRI